MAFCSHCGASRSESWQFCRQCGDPTADSSARTEFCTHCGSSVAAHWSNCVMCGAKQVREVEETPPTETPQARVEQPAAGEAAWSQAQSRIDRLFGQARSRVEGTTASDEFLVVESTIAEPPLIEFAAEPPSPPVDEAPERVVEEHPPPPPGLPKEPSRSPGWDEQKQILRERLGNLEGRDPGGPSAPPPSAPQPAPPTPQAAPAASTPQPAPPSPPPAPTGSAQQLATAAEAFPAAADIELLDVEAHADSAPLAGAKAATGFRSASNLGRGARVGLLLLGLLSVWAITGLVVLNHRLQAFGADEGGFGPVVSIQDLLDRWLLPAAIGGIIVVTVLLVFWSHRSYSNLPAFGVTDLNPPLGWDIAAWAVPVINLVAPKRVMNDAWRGAAKGAAEDPDWRSVRPNLWISVFWFSLIAAIAVIVYAGLVPADTVEEAIDLNAWSIVGYGLLLVACVGGVQAITLIDARQERRSLD